MIDDKEHDGRYHIGGIKENEIELEEFETDKRNQIENTLSLKRIDNKQIRKNVYLVDTDTDLEKDAVLEYTTEITELQLNNEGLGNVAVHSTENNKLSTSESVARKMT